MMGKTHLAIGAAAYSVLVPPDLMNFHWWDGLAAALFASILPDIDEPRSTIGRVLMPVVPRWLRPAAFAFVGLLLLWQGFQRGEWAILFVGLALVACTLAKHRNNPTHGLVGLVLAGALVYLYFPAYFLPFVIGYASHLLADALTEEGIPLLWPAPVKFRIPITHTNSLLERFVIRNAALLVVAYRIAH